MVVHDLHNVLWIQIVHRLGHLIVIYQYDLLVCGIGELLRIGDLEVVQQKLGLPIELSRRSRHSLLHAQSILEIGIGYCRCYGVGIRALVPNHIDLVGQMKHLSIVNVRLRLKAY